MKADEDWWHAKDLPLADAIRRAVASKMQPIEHGPGKHHPHQQRIRSDAYAKCTKALEAIENILAKTLDFDDLLQLVDKTIGGIEGVGEMIVYDIADRIALHLGLEPTLIYLHRGTRVGAMELVPNLTKKQTNLEIAKLPEPLRIMTARELENALCIYKRNFRDWKFGNRFQS